MGDCKVNSLSSRACERGTKGCDVRHGEEDKQALKQRLIDAVNEDSLDGHYPLTEGRILQLIESVFSDK